MNNAHTIKANDAPKHTETCTNPSKRAQIRHAKKHSQTKPTITQIRTHRHANKNTGKTHTRKHTYKYTKEHKQHKTTARKKLTLAHPLSLTKKNNNKPTNKQKHEHEEKIPFSADTEAPRL